MCLYEIIRTLHEERKRLDKIIRRIQELQEPADERKRRPGRDSITPEEELELSRRKKQGGAQRRQRPP